MDFKELIVEELQKYIGTEIFIIHPGSNIDDYWGTIDSVSPHIIHVIIDEFNISTLGIEIITDDGQNCYNVNDWEIFLDEEKRYQSEEEVEDYDLMHVISSDIIIVNLNGLNTSDGTKIELHEAKYNNKIPVIAFGDYGLYKNLHPWIQRAITRVETTMEDTVNYIKDFYMI